jgi:hypothetical protein
MRKGGRSWRAIAIAAVCALLPPGPAAPFDCNRNLLDDFAEIQGGAATDCDGNGIPDACDIEPINHGLRVAANRTVQLGSGSSFVLPADVDGDGHADLAAALPEESVARVFWGDGSGGFGGATQQLTARAGTSLAVGDMDADGLADLLAGGPAGMIFLRQFAPRSFRTRIAPAPVESARGAIAASDLDGDGDLDILFAAAFEVLVFRNGGAWSFEEPASIPAGSGPVHLTTSDIDNDGDPDIATANFLLSSPSGSASAFLNRGDATFLPGRNFAVGAAPASLDVRDVDGDGIPDLVASSAGHSDVAILLGKGDGTFTPLPRLPVPGRVSSAAVGDLDGDGDPDLAVAGAEPLLGMGTVWVWWNHGGAAFRRAFGSGSGGSLSAIGIRDFYGDAAPEVFVSEVNQGRLLVLEKALVAHHEDCDRNGVPDPCDIAERDCNRNHIVDACDLTQGQSRDCDLDGLPDECEADCNSNGTPDDCDLALGTSPDCNLNTIPDECDIRSLSFGFEQSPVGVVGEGLGPLIAPDLDADGRPDLAGLDSLGRVLVHWNDGGSLASAKLAADAGRAASLAAGDIDGDGDLDFIFGSQDTRLLQAALQSGMRAFSRGPDTPLPESPVTMVSADLDGDGLADAAAATGSGGILILPGRGDGALGPERSGPQGVARHFIAAADVDGDGARDLAAILSSGAPAVFWNRGDGSFEGGTELGSAFFHRTLAIEDVDTDGDLDVAAGDAGNVIIFRQVGRRAFERGAHIRGLDLQALAAADLDRDGHADIAVAQGGVFEAGIAIHLQNGEGVFEAVNAISPEGGFGAMVAADFDGAGGTDLAATFCRFCALPGRVILLRNLTVPAASRDANDDGRPDECDSGGFRRGDSDGDGALDLADAVFTLRALFQGGQDLGCAEAADLDNDGSINVTDPISVLEFLFRGGPPPAAPGPPPGPCGLDTDPPGSPADLGCAAYASC